MLVERMVNYVEQHVDDTYADVMRILLQNLRRTKGMNQEQLAALCHTSVSTISRMARLLGYGSFSAFRCELGAIVENINRHPKELTEQDVQKRFAMDVQQLVQLQERVLQHVQAQTLNEIVGAIHAAQSVRLYLADTPPSYTLLIHMLHAGISARMVESVEHELEDAKQLGPHDLVLLATGRSDRLELKREVIELVQKSEAKFVVLAVGPAPEVRPNDLLVSLPACPMPMNVFLIDEILKLIDQAFL